MKSRLRSYSEAMTQGVFGRDHGIGGGYLPVAPRGWSRPGRRAPLRIDPGNRRGSSRTRRSARPARGVCRRRAGLWTCPGDEAGRQRLLGLRLRPAGPGQDDHGGDARHDEDHQQNDPLVRPASAAPVVRLPVAVRVPPVVALACSMAFADQRVRCGVGAREPYRWVNRQRRAGGEIDGRQVRIAPIFRGVRRELGLDRRQELICRDPARFGAVSQVVSVVLPMERVFVSPSLGFQALGVSHPALVAASGTLHAFLLGDWVDEDRQPVEFDVDTARTAARTGRHANGRVSPNGPTVKRDAGAGKEKALSGVHPERASVVSVSAAGTRSSSGRGSRRRWPQSLQP